MVKIGRQKNRPNTLVSAASVRWRTLAEKVYYVQLGGPPRQRYKLRARKKKFDFVQKAGPFHDLAGRGTSGKKAGLSRQKRDGWQVCN